MAMTVCISTAPPCFSNGARTQVTQLGELPFHGGATALQVKQGFGHATVSLSLAYHYARLTATKKENSRIVTSMSRTRYVRVPQRLISGPRRVHPNEGSNCTEQQQ